ncbi:MAG: hypothetical protein Q8K10_18905 [Methylobacter sp.]|nr:hypothetical protein [Methylobacter sp.]
MPGCFGQFAGEELFQTGFKASGTGSAQSGDGFPPSFTITLATQQHIADRCQLCRR